jgi:hypothetical protein
LWTKWKNISKERLKMYSEAVVFEKFLKY